MYSSSPYLSSTCGGDAGVSHPLPSFLVRMNIRGKPGDSIIKYNRHYSCGDAAQWWLDTSFYGYVIPPEGELVVDYPTNIPFTCNDPILGGWESYVMVGPLFSNVATFTYYNSPCGGSLSTCSTASNYCPPSGPCNNPDCS
jgi:hypothetical protein